MSGHKKINDDELEKLLHESLPYAENEMPAVTDELMDKTMEFIKKNTNPEKIPETGSNINYGKLSGKDAPSGHKAKSAKRYIGWISGAAACFAITFAAVFAIHSNVSKPDYNGSSTDVAMDDSTDSYESTTGESADGAYDDDAYDDDCDNYDASAFDDEDVSKDFTMEESAGVSEETSDSSAGVSEEIPDSSNEDSEETTEDSSSETSKDSSNEASEDYITAGDNTIKSRIKSDEIIFPDTVLGYSRDNITGILVKTSNGETKKLTGYDIEAFCEEMEEEFLSKKEIYQTVKKSYSELPNDWIKKTVIQLKEYDSSYETIYYTIFTYEDGFAVCPFSPQESNPDLICVLYK